MNFDLSLYKDKKVFVTGHTGFKGSWLCKILANAGADVTGYSLNPSTTPSLFEIANISQDIHSVIGDIRDYKALKAAFDEAKATKGMPTAIIAKTVKGKGVSYMEGQVGWHGKAPNDEEYAIAMAELEKAGEALCQK